MNANTLFTVTPATCGEACWHAREDVCRCSCGGANHGCLRGAGGERPVRTCRIDGFRYELLSVGEGSEEAARSLCEAEAIAAGRRHYPWHDYMARGAAARLKSAGRDQIARWPELAAWRDLDRWDPTPYIAWRRIA